MSETHNLYQEKESVLLLDITGYEGPMDLLLQLAQDQKVDLKEISIVELVDQYFQFIKKTTQLRIELAAEYLVMAAWLAYLKSKLLLPLEEDPSEISGHEMEEYLAFQLKRLANFRACANQLFQRPQLGVEFFPRGQVEGIDQIEVKRLHMNLLDLLKSYAKIGARNSFSSYQFVRGSILTFDQAFKAVTTFLLTKTGWVRLEQIIPPNWRKKPTEARSAIASTFAASLELVRIGKLEISQKTHFQPVRIKLLHTEDKV